MPLATARQFAGAVARVPVRTFNDDGSTLTPPDLSAYFEQSAKLEQIQRDQLELQQLQVWQAEQAALELAQSSRKSPAKTVRAGPAVPVRPYLIDLTGVGDDLQARVMVPGYGETTVRSGQTLPNHWQIESIDDDGVSFRTGPGRPLQRIVYQTQDAAAMGLSQSPDPVAHAAKADTQAAPNRKAGHRKSNDSGQAA